MILKKIIPVLIACFLVSNSYGQQELANISDPRLVINLPTLKGDSLALSTLKGKVVLLDFWASWCLPCRAANRRLVKLYDKYKSAGFQIFSVSLDEEKKPWAKAVEKDKITWLQVNDDRGTMAKTVLDWNVSVIPTTFLINKKGDVVGIDLEGHELEDAVKKLLQE